jgi:hypothetical protein
MQAVQSRASTPAAFDAPRAAVTLVAAVLLLLPVTVQGQVIHGRVIHDATSAPLDLVTMELLDAAGERRGGVVTDTLGRFSVRVPEPGSYRVRLRRIGFADVVTDPVRVVTGEQVELELRMSVTVVPLEPLRVVGREEYVPGRLREYYERAGLSRRMGRGRVFMRDDLERMHFAQPSAILTHLPPRGGCRPAILLDGLPVSSVQELDAVVYMAALEGVELYSGPSQMPQEYSNRGYCAVALFWTRHDVEHARPLTWRRVFLAVGIVIAGFLLMR